MIPRGVIHRWAPEKGSTNAGWSIESAQPIVTPKRYRNHFGQLLEHSPYLRARFPLARTSDPCQIKRCVSHRHPEGRHDPHGHLRGHPFDVVGWDGYHFPYAFSIHDFEPITGRVHQPPPVHQTFETNAFVICSFCPEAL